MNLQKIFKDEIKSILKIEKGFSLDEKYIINGKYIVRIISLDRYEQFKEVFRVQKAFEKVALCQKAFELTKDEVCGYYITEYIKGKNGLEVIEGFSNDKQYELGKVAAKEIVKFHKAYPINNFDMKTHLDNYLNSKIQLALEINVKALLPEIDEIITLVSNNIHHLYSLKGVQTHADYHLFNMIFHKGDYKGVIDFERVRPGPILTDFRNNTPHNSKISPYFASGYIDGYLEEVEINDFFLMYNIYDLLLTIAAIPWVQKFDSKSIDKNIQVIQSIYEQKDNLQGSPKWYVGKY
ncbi:MAG: aminoglycoside phosphotransferase family protein [Candidatus Izemoplasmataceae bacterium]